MRPNSEINSKDYFNDGVGSIANNQLSRNTPSPDLEKSDGGSVAESSAKGLRKHMPPGSPEGKWTEKAFKRLSNADASSLAAVTLDYRAALAEPGDPTMFLEAISNNRSELTEPLALSKVSKKSKRKRRRKG